MSRRRSKNYPTLFPESGDDAVPLRAPSTVNSIVYAPPWKGGGVKSLYAACEGLGRLGQATIAPFHESCLASWFNHSCELYDFSYFPDLVVYPESHQPRIDGCRHICFVLGKHGLVSPHADLAVCRSEALVSWVAAHTAATPTILLQPSIDRKIFGYDGRAKRNVIAYMTRPDKYPETAQLLHERYPDQVVEIIDRPEAEVAEILKSAKVFVWRGDHMEGSPRPPKEALLAGCVVVGLATDLDAAHHTDFGLRCATVDEMIETAGRALSLPIPTVVERSVIRDAEEEKQDWVRITTQFMQL
jgi:hypothetical protein